MNNWIKKDHSIDKDHSIKVVQWECWGVSFFGVIMFYLFLDLRNTHVGSVTVGIENLFCITAEKKTEQKRGNPNFLSNSLSSSWYHNISSSMVNPSAIDSTSISSSSKMAISMLSSSYHLHWFKLWIQPHNQLQWSLMRTTSSSKNNRSMLQFVD